MTARTSHPRLHALMGDAAFDVDGDLAHDLETALQAQSLPRPRPAFFNNLDAIRLGDCVDGQPSDTRQRARTPYENASMSRTVGGLMVVLELLHAAERTRVEGEDDGQVEDYLIDGMVLAARQLALLVQTGLGGEG